MHHAVMRICISYRMPIGNTYSHNCMMHRDTMLVCAQKCFFWGDEGEDVKILCSNAQKALFSVNTRLLVYRVSKSVPRLGRWKDLVYKDKNKKTEW